MIKTKPKKLAFALAAHVDAGKTTLSEAVLHYCGVTKKLGRVDRGDAFLDNHEIEKERGITIFSKTARFSHENVDFTLLDTPGHVDFSAETERVLSVIDCAVVVISGSEGTQAHTETLWALLERYRVPAFVFVTKMDMPTSDRNMVKSSLASLDGSIVDFSLPREERDELCAACDEVLLEKYTSGEDLDDSDIMTAVAQRKIFPCFFGSGLKNDGIEALLSALVKFAEILPENRTYDEDELFEREKFGGVVYKIAHDPSGVRLTFLRVTSGSLENRMVLSYFPRQSAEPVAEKITGIRLYSGAKYETVTTAGLGDICAVAGLSKTYVGQGLGEAGKSADPQLMPVLYYRIKLPPEVSPIQFLPKLRELEEEEPLLHIVWNERYSEIHAQVMGEVQTEVLTRLIHDRYGVEAELDEGRIMYRETVAGKIEGVGHFEPLRHYAEVHLLLEPLPPGSGVVYAVDSRVNTAEAPLDVNWQRLIISSLEEKEHIGTLTGSPITDIKITLVSGRAHLKHTQGGDFREAAWRALRQGLMELRERDKLVLLEPFYKFKLEIPTEYMGRAISDITSREGTYAEKESSRGSAYTLIEGEAPASTIGDYAQEVAAYTHGKGKFSSVLSGFYPCHNAKRVIEDIGYSPESDIDNSPDSVFCSHGAGIVVPWNEVPQYMHLTFRREYESSEEDLSAPHVIKKNLDIDEKELEAIMEREFGPIRRPVYSDPKTPVITNHKPVSRKKYLYIVDGYNVIFAWDELSAIAQHDLEAARRQLCEILSNYKSFTGRDIVLVFDAYNVKGAARRKLDWGGIAVVYTKEGELGDTYIEKLVYEIGEDLSVKVVTSDGLIQLQAVRSGVLRLSAREFREEVLKADRDIEEILAKLREKK